MGSRLAVCKILRRGKCIALLLISLWVVAWITFSGENKKLFHVFYPMSLALVSQDGTDNTVNLRTAVPEDRRTQPPKAECPQESPLLSKCTLTDVKERCVWLCFKQVFFFFSFFNPTVQFSFPGLLLSLLCRILLDCFFSICLISFTLTT